MQPPRWSYDGLFLAYADDCFDREPRVAQIRVATATGDAELELTDYSSLNHLSRQPWSPNLENSEQLTFISDRDGDNDVYVMNSDGTGVTQITTDSDAQFEAVWSPTGTSIAYTTQVIQPSGDSQTSVMKIDPNGANETTVVTGSPHATEPLWSPDGTRMVVTRGTRLGAPTAVVVDADGSNEITVGKGFDSVDAAWAPTSSALLFAIGDLVRVRFTADGVATKTVLESKAPEIAVDWQAIPN
jgi:Tol biopolymer transport system component